MPMQPSQIIDVNSDPSLSHKSPTVTYQANPYARPKYHLIRTSITPPNAIPYTLTTVASPPSTVDLRPWCSPVDDQGNLGSCTGNATAGAIDYMDRRYNNKQTQVSRLFIYYYERLLEGTVRTDSGAYVHDGIRATYTYGAPLESLWPYNISKFAVVPSSQAISDATRRKVTLYQSVADFNGCINALQNGYPVIIGFDVYSSFESVSVARTGMMPYPNTRTEQLLGGHCVLLVGYNNNTQRFIVRNSWGTSWGDGGYFYMPYQVIQNTNMSSDFWVIKTVSDPT